MGLSRDVRASSGTALEHHQEEYDDAAQSISIGDRIEGIRACLEARLGTQKFQTLYRSLSLASTALAAVVAAGTGSTSGDVGLPGGGAGDGRPAAVEELGLSDELKEVFSDAAGCENDLGSLAPLVAKLVDCEQRYFS
jgi:hypothetical protein